MRPSAHLMFCTLTTLYPRGTHRCEFRRVRIIDLPEHTEFELADKGAQIFDHANLSDERKNWTTCYSSKRIQSSMQLRVGETRERWKLDLEFAHREIED